MLPTGAGKTPVASSIVKKRLHGQTWKAVFLVPTIVLVEQQAKVLREWTSLSVIELCGEKCPSSFEKFDILVSTPKAFQTIQATGHKNLSWSSLGIVVFDEVHHVIKDHPYRQIAHSLQKIGSSDRPMILGLSASLTYAVESSKVKSSLEKLCQDLGVQVIESASPEEMESQGYHARKGAVEVSLVEGVTPMGVVEEPASKPHLMLPIFRERLHENKSTEFTKAIFRCICAMEEDIQSADPTFVPQIFKSGLKEWGKYTHNRGSKCARSQALSCWYEAMRLLVVSWEEGEDMAIAFLRMSEAFESSRLSLWSSHIQDLILSLEITDVEAFPRFVHLKNILRSKIQCDEDDAKPKFRGIIFVQQRVTTHILKHIIASDAFLSARLSPECLYATSSPATPLLSVSSSQSKARLAAFANGTCNLLITTVVAEEGLDVPEANCVIRFDPVINSVSLVQGEGRGRQKDSSSVVMSERKDRPVSKYVTKAHQFQTFIIG